jgi:monoterpene epsilon-lactone hydrolase
VSAETEAAAELAKAIAAVAGRMRGVDPNDTAAQRRAYDAFAADDPVPANMSESEIKLGGVNCLGLLPKGANGDDVILWLHGGGFNLGSSRSHRAFVAQVASAGRLAAVVPDYRLAPEHKHPAALEDVLTVYRCVLKEGVKPDRLILAGDSAGGCLVLAAALALKAKGEPMPAGLLLASPWANLDNTGWSWTAKAQRDPFLTKQGLDARREAYLGGAATRDAGLDIFNADLRGLPPTFIQTGEADVLLSDSTTLAERLGGAGVPVTLEIWPDMFHVFQARFPMLSHARQAVERMGSWASAHIAR